MRKQLLVLLTAALLLAAAITCWAALRARGKPEWTTSSPAALAEFRRGLDADQKFYQAEATGHFISALEKDPQFAAARVMLLRDSRKSPQRRVQLAALEAIDVATLTPREAFLVAYQVDVERERYQEARARLDRYLATYPHDPYALDVAVNTHWDDQQWAAAETTCKELLDVDPNWVSAQNKLGYLSMAQGRFAEAEDRFRTYLYIAPDQANPHDSLGELMALLGRFDDARRELETAIAMRPDFCASYYHLAQTALMQRNVAASRAAIDRARQVPACAGYELDVRTCSQGMWEMYARRDWPALAQAFDSPCEQATHATYWMPHLGAAMLGDLARARQIEAAAKQWFDKSGPSGQALVGHVQGIRLLAEGNAAAAADRFAAVDAGLNYFGMDLGVFKLYNRLQWAHALEMTDRSQQAAKLVAEVAAVNAPFAELYRQGKVIVPQPKVTAPGK